MSRSSIQLLVVIIDDDDDDDDDDDETLEKIIQLQCEMKKHGRPKARPREKSEQKHSGPVVGTTQGRESARA